MGIGMGSLDPEMKQDSIGFMELHWLVNGDEVADEAINHHHQCYDAAW